jgi:hypothetical protein
LSLAQVELDSRLQVYEAKLSARASLYGLRYLWYHWRLTTAVVYVLFVWGLQVFWITCWFVACLSKAGCFKRGQEEEDEELKEEEQALVEYQRFEQLPVFNEDDSITHDAVAFPGASDNSNTAQTKVRRRKIKI